MKKDALVYFLGKIVPALVTLAIIILGVRMLGEAEYGRYSLVFYASMLVSTLTFGWIQQSTIRFLSAHSGDLDRVINRFFHLTLLSAVAAILVMFPLCLFYFGLSWTETGIVLSYVFLYNFYWFNLTLNIAQSKPVRFALLEGSFNLIYLAVLLVFLYGFGMKWFAVLFLSMSLGLVFAECIRTGIPASQKFRVNLRHFYWDTAFTKKMFDFGFTLTLWLFLSYIVTIADRFIIKEYFSYAEVGIYSAVKDLIIKISTFAAAPVILAYHPGIVREWNLKNKQEAARLIRESILFILAEFAIVLAVFLLLQDFIYSRVLHLTAQIPHLLSAFLLGSAFLWNLAMMVHKPLELLLKQRIMIVAVSAVLAINVGANLLLVPRFGLLAAAVTAFSSSLLYILIVVLIIYRKFASELNPSQRE
jgi:O-antigen/teichoic acid export membrane protein